MTYYGAEINSSILLDESYLPIIADFQQIEYPYWVKALNENMDLTNPAVSQLGTAVFFWASPINDRTQTDSNRFHSLIKTSNKAWQKQGDVISVDFENFSHGNQGQYTLASLVDGKIQSKYKDQQVPSLPEGTEDKRTADIVRVDESEDIKLVIVGDSSFLLDQVIQGFQGAQSGAVFFLNTVEWLSNNEALMSIRSKNIQTKPLELTSESQKNISKAALIVIMPVVTAAFGVAYNLIDRKKPSKIS